MPTNRIEAVGPEASSVHSSPPAESLVENDTTAGDARSVSPPAVAREPLISATDRTVPVTVEVRSTLTPADAFAIIVPIDLSLVFKKWGPIPGVLESRNQTGAWDSAGQSRNPYLTDGSTADERLVEYTPGHSFAYEVTNFTGPMRYLVAGVRGEWTFSPDGRGTLVRWTYEFKAVRGRHLLLRWSLVPIWRRYMLTAIIGTARESERISAARHLV